MKLPAFILLCGLSAPLLMADDLTIGDATYKKWSVLKVEPDGLKIEHSDGITKIPMEKLPPDLAAKYQFDPAKAKAFREKKAADAKAADAKAAEAMKPVEKPAGKPAGEPAAAAPDKAAEAKPAGGGQPDPEGWENIPPDPKLAVKGKTFGIAEVQQRMHELNGKIIRVEVIVNSASQIEAIDADSCRMFAGSVFKKDSNWEFIGFPVEGVAKMRTLLRGTKGTMLFWVRVEAENQWPFPQLWVVGRTLHEGGLGTPPKFQW
jgi:hypothetical protein